MKVSFATLLHCCLHDQQVQVQRETTSALVYFHVYFQDPSSTVSSLDTYLSLDFQDILLLNFTNTKPKPGNPCLSLPNCAFCYKTVL